MNHSKANLTTLTPEHVQPMPPRALLERCEKLGILAYQFSNSGELVASSSKPVLASAWMRSPAVMHHVQAHIAGAGPLPGSTNTSRAEIMPGFTLVVVCHGMVPECTGWTAALLPTAAGLNSPAFTKSCTDAGLDAAPVAAELSTFSRELPREVDLIAGILAEGATDFTTISDQQSALAGFTAQLTDSYDTMDLLYSVGRSMREPFKPEQFFTFVCGRLFSTMSFRWIAIRFADEAWIANGLRGKLIMAGEPPLKPDAFKPVADRFVGLGAQPQVIERIAGLSSQNQPQILAQPLLCKGRPVGVLMCGGKYGEDPDISSYDIQLVEAAAGYINAFSDNVALYEDQHNLFMGTVQALTAAIDAKDRYTFGHSERVAHIASMLSLEIGWSKEQAERVRIAGLVHDVGKIGVPEAVLTKAGKLTDEEFGHIKKHPEIGYNILRDIRLLDDVLPGVLHHHERWDGRGYPHKIAGENIPLIARILAVADTFDAMSSTRSYRSAMPRDVVLAEIVKCAGSQFDPALAIAFGKLDLTTYDEMVARHAANLVTRAA